MRKQIFGRRLKRDTNERKALFRSLMIGLILHGKITTTEAKAKSIKAEVEKLVTVARNKKEEARPQLIKKLANASAADKIIKEVAPLFATRPGGYTRILRLAPRLKDNSTQVLMTWTEEVKATSFTQEKRNKGKAVGEEKKAVKKEKKVEVKEKAKAKK